MFKFNQNMFGIFLANSETMFCYALQQVHTINLKL